MYTISKQITFAASHQLDHLPDGHKCARLHGHNYIVELQLTANDLDKDGFVVDFGDLHRFRSFLVECLDHRHLNDVMPMPSTSENLARWLYQEAKAMWPEITRVRVSETPGSWATFDED